MFEELLTDSAIGSAMTAIIVVGSVAFKLYLDWRRQAEASEQVIQAEKEAFKDKPDELDGRLRELSESQTDIEERVKQAATLMEESRSAITLRRLFNLYSKQIEKYQQQTRTRATWSFIFAIAAMFAGLGFVVWGGAVLLKAEQTIVLAAGGLLSAIGGAVGAYITKTFLDVHKLSLHQLNRYFQQPVINDHILMAQRLADESGDPDTRKQAYRAVIDSISGLITAKSGAKPEGG
jgi:hypothetical protein